jgi:uncharacterized protein YraI
MSTRSRRGLKISDAADALYTSQPNISKQIKQLEQELGIDISCATARVVAITEPGRHPRHRPAHAARRGKPPVWGRNSTRRQRPPDHRHHPHPKSYIPPPVVKQPSGAT